MCRISLQVRLSTVTIQAGIYSFFLSTVLLSIHVKWLTLLQTTSLWHRSSFFVFWIWDKTRAFADSSPRMSICCCSSWFLRSHSSRCVWNSRSLNLLVSWTKMSIVFSSDWKQTDKNVLDSFFAK
jgi:hypothetical protein